MGGLGHSRRRTEVVLADNTGLEEVRIAVAVELSACSFPQTSIPSARNLPDNPGVHRSCINLVSIYSNAPPTTTLSARSTQAGSSHAMAVEVR